LLTFPILLLPVCLFFITTNSSNWKQSLDQLPPMDEQIWVVQQRPGFRKSLENKSRHLLCSWASKACKIVGTCRISLVKLSKYLKECANLCNCCNCFRFCEVGRGVDECVLWLSEIIIHSQVSKESF
jgi:hypothetical protein